MDKNNEAYLARGSISRLFSYFNIYKPEKEKKKENKTNLNLEYVINTYTNYCIDDYLIHSKIFLEYDNSEAFIILLKECILLSFEILEEKKIIVDNPIISIILFTQLYNFDLTINPGDLNSIILLYFDNTLENKVESKLNFNFSKDSILVHHFIKKYYILNWQKTYEEIILKDYLDEIYQYHFYIKKINSRGKSQDRILMLSNKVNIFLNILVVYI